MTTVSEAIPVPIGGGMPQRQPDLEADSPGVRVHARASLAVTERDGNRLVAKARSATSAMVADLREAWCWPASVPTLQRAWADRYPDRDTVPGGNAGLYYGWVIYNHALGLPLVAAAYAVIGALTPLVWVFLHPARAVLFLTVAAAAAALIYA